MHGCSRNGLWPKEFDSEEPASRMKSIAGKKPGNRVERDSMGEVRVPADALYGGQTQRAVENFPISDLRFPREFIRALGLVKLAAAQANMDLHLLDKKVGQAIIQAARE